MKTTSEFAEIFNVTPKCVRDWIADGLPVVKAGKRGAGNESHIDLEAGVRWYFEADRQLLELNQQRARLAKEQADKTAMDNTVKRGELLSVRTVEIEIGRMFSSMRAKLLGLPTKLAPRVAREKTPARCLDLMTTEIHACLTELSEYRPGDEPQDDEEPT